MKNYENDDLLISLREASKLMGVSVDTLRNWDKNNKLKPIRTVGNHRRYKRKDIIKMLDSNYGELKGKTNLIKDKIVVYVYICGDILHRGHLLHLKNAALLGDFLIVGVLTDEAVMEKKPIPLIPFEERIELVECLKMVDMVVPQHQYSPCLNITRLKPDILIESDSHDKELIEEGKKQMKEMGGEVVVASYYPYQSSTGIKNKIKNERKE